jgi:hypothetical protein
MHAERLRSAADLYWCTDDLESLQGRKKVQESAILNWASKARHAICKSHKSLYIGDGPGVVQRFRNLAPRLGEKLALRNGRVVHYV